MYILQISDFHCPKHDSKRCEAIIDAVIEKLNSYSTSNRGTLLVLVCGDIIDKGNIAGYAQATLLCNKLKQKLSENFDVHFGFVPGNHDTVNGGRFSDFSGFIQSYGIQWDVNKTSCISISIDNMDIVFCNSTQGDKDRGEIDFDRLNTLLDGLPKDCRKILILHHTLMSMDEKDTSSILNAAQLIPITEKHSVSLILHGHTHGLDSIPIGSHQCVILGVGALFSNPDYPDVNSQFNLITLNAGKLEEIINYTYHGESARPEERMSGQKLTVPERRMNNIFFGSSISDIYSSLINALNMQNPQPLYNVVLSGVFKFEDFKNDINENFGKITDFEFDYRTLASKWQADECPPELFFTHAEKYYNSTAKQSGIDFIIQMLQTKKTSSRAVLSTICMKDIEDSSDYFLPSLLLIQFSFDSNTSDTLKVTLYLRALEARRFLKINICEVLYLVQKIKDATPIIDFDKVEIAINAFRVQIKENFSCFIKSELDMLSEEDIQDYVSNQDYDKIAALLDGKNKHAETVIFSTGIEHLKTKMNWYKNCSRYEDKQYPDNIYSSIDKIIDKLNALKRRWEGTSIYSELDEDEKKLKESINKAVEIFKREAKK